MAMRPPTHQWIRSVLKKDGFQIGKWSRRCRVSHWFMGDIEVKSGGNTHEVVIVIWKDANKSDVINALVKHGYDVEDMDARGLLVTRKDEPDDITV